MRWLLVVTTLGMLFGIDVLSAEEKRDNPKPAGPRSVGPSKETGTSQAIVVDPVALAHTSQLLPLDASGRIVGKDNPAAQIEQVLEHLSTALKETRSSFDHAVKINVYVRRAQLVADVHKALAKRFDGAVKPAVSFVEGALAHPEALVAMDAVAAAPENALADVKRARSAALPGSPEGTHVAVLPAGPHVYVSGQAAGKGDDMAKATRQTMEGLRATLKHLSLDETHVVQLKIFLNPSQPQQTCREKSRGASATSPCHRWSSSNGSMTCLLRSSWWPPAGPPRTSLPSRSSFSRHRAWKHLPCTAGSPGSIAAS
jgi:enamine deaminase RidA (YjgF/YER057c/UK114 family)